MNSLDVKTMVVNDEGSLETATQNIDNMIAAGVDGVVFFGVSETLFPVLSQKCEASKIPFVCYDHMPSDENLEILKANPYYKGAVGTRDVNTGRNIGEYAASMDLKKAVIVTGGITDPTHNARVNGFTEAFESAGGKVLDVAWDATEASVAITKLNDLLTANPDVDCIYTSSGGTGSGAIEVMQQRDNIDAKLFVTDLDPDILAGLESGIVAAANGAHWINANFATTLLINSILGHELKGEDDKAPELIVPVMILPSEFVDYYDKFWIQSQPFSAEELQQLVVSWNKDVTLKDYEDMLADYTVESRLKQKAEEGLVTNEELESLGIK